MAAGDDEPALAIACTLDQEKTLAFQAATRVLQVLAGPA
jgi:hypothetical protein